MAGFNTFTLFINLSLILFVSISQAARKPFTTTTTSLTTPNEVNITVKLTHTLAPMTSPSTKDEAKGIPEVEEEENDDCSGLEMEECLPRRSMVAHTDYIYTQDINNGP